MLIIFDIKYLNCW